MHLIFSHKSPIYFMIFRLNICNSNYFICVLKWKLISGGVVLARKHRSASSLKLWTSSVLKTYVFEWITVMNMNTFVMKEFDQVFNAISIIFFGTSLIFRAKWTIFNKTMSPKMVLLYWDIFSATQWTDDERNGAWRRKLRCSREHRNWY